MTELKTTDGEFKLNAVEWIVCLIVLGVVVCSVDKLCSLILGR